MSVIQEDENSRFKLAQVWYTFTRTVKCNSNIDSIQRVVNSILTKDVNINYKVTINPDMEVYKVHFKDCTALHFTFYIRLDIDTFTTFIERGADFTIKNANGQTALHLIISRCYKTRRDILFSFINAVLSAHVKLQISSNPRDHNGISHLHGACITNHVDALELFLNSGASVNEAIDLNVPLLAGYTPLHFAVEFHSVEVAHILVNYGADINVKNAAGLTPLDISIQHRLDTSDRDQETYPRKISDCQKIIELLLRQQCLTTLGLSKFHIACSLKNLTIVESFLDQVVDINEAVSMESALSPGNTALHFAVDTSIEAVKYLVKRGAKIVIPNGKGLTPLDICVNKYNVEDICDVLSCNENWINIFMTDGKTKLLDVIRAIADQNSLELFLSKNSINDLSVSNEAEILAGCTLLHLAVIFSKLIQKPRNWDQSYNDKIVLKCLEHNLDINAQNSRGQTPIHVAARSGKKNIVALLLERVDRLDEVNDIVDEDNLSYLHIASAMEVHSLVEKLLRNSSPNVVYKGKSILMKTIETGSTPLHQAAGNGSQTIANILLENGADLHAADKNGMTPIHWLIKLDWDETQGIFNVLFNSLLEKLEDRVVDKIGLSYLHIACYVGHFQAVKKLIDFGSNLNLTISYENPLHIRNFDNHLWRLEKFSMYKPFHMSQISQNVEVENFLMRHGADIFGKVPREGHLIGQYWSYPLDKKVIICRFMSILWDDKDMQKSIEEKLGLTRLHIACQMKNEEAIKIALNEGIDINAQVNKDSQIFAGCTPLHLLMIVSDFGTYAYNRNVTHNIEPMIKLLLNHGADVTISNAKNDTPIHVFFGYQSRFTQSDRCRILLLNSQKNFSINPVGADGFSHFHLACYWHENEIVEKFLERKSVDVNQSIDCFSRFHPGQTPLHVTLDSYMQPNSDWTKLLQTVDILLKNGADVNARDVRGETPLLKSDALRSPNSSVIDKLLEYGADIECKNIWCETILDKSDGECTMHNASLLKKYGHHINRWNNFTGEGYIGKLIFTSRHEKITDIIEYQNLIQSPSVQAIDNRGRTVIHNSVAALPPAYDFQNNFIYTLEKFIDQGVDIDYQDQSGETALHYAARMENGSAVKGLLSYGADMNIIDNNGKSAFSKVMGYTKAKARLAYYSEIIEIFNLQLKKLQYLKLKVDQINENISAGLKSLEYRAVGDFFEHGGKESIILQPFFDQVEIAKTKNVGVGSLTLFDFLSETGIVSCYNFIPLSEQVAINDFFKSISEEEFNELIGIVKLQFRKMITRSDVTEPAIVSLRKLLGFSFAGLCEEITKFLAISDLKHLISSTA